uniref:Uncharacterized protein n=1 Tax=Picea sitchensis TaxID=3332 RepID=D5AC73_PICSI|nr:unknown [Picea sitchensis]
MLFKFIFCLCFKVCLHTSMTDFAMNTGYREGSNAFNALIHLGNAFWLKDDAIGHYDDDLLRKISGRSVRDDETAAI